jgi:hypothetical protein
VTHRVRLPSLLSFALALAACADRAPADPDESPSCADLSAAMLEQCADEFEALFDCIDVAGVEACDAQNVAHGECIDTADGDATQQEHDAAFSRYLCEVADEPAPDCDMRIAACE